jgi:hypothetical protein
MEEVLPLYFPVFVMEEMVVIEPPTFLCHWTEVTGKLEDTKHMSVTVLPKLTEYEGCCIVTTSVGTGQSSTTQLSVVGSRC